MLVAMEKRFAEWVKEHQADDGNSDVMFLRKAYVAGTNDEREECAKVAKSEEEAAVKLMRKVESFPGSAGARAYEHYERGGVVARRIKCAICARGKA